MSSSKGSLNGYRTWNDEPAPTVAGVAHAAAERRGESRNRTVGKCRWPTGDYIYIALERRRADDIDDELTWCGA